MCVNCSRSCIDLYLYRYLQAVLLQCCLPRGTHSPGFGFLAIMIVEKQKELWEPGSVLSLYVHLAMMKHHDGQVYLLLYVMTGSGGCLTALNYNAARLSCRSSPFLWLLRWPWRALGSAASTSTILLGCFLFVFYLCVPNYTSIDVIIVYFIIICQQLDAPRSTFSRLFRHFLVC